MSTEIKSNSHLQANIERSIVTIELLYSVIEDYTEKRYKNADCRDQTIFLEGFNYLITDIGTTLNDCHSFIDGKGN